jgi:mRNA interferase RelE/StbE
VYRIFISASAEKALKRVPSKDQQRLAAAIWSLAVNPKPIGSKKLRGYEQTYRLRVGDYRIIYEIEDQKLIITVLKVGHCKDIYRQL